MSRAVLSNLDLGGVARVVGLLDPTSAQDAATRAYVLARAPEDLLANIQVTPGGGTGAGGVYLAADLAGLISSTATNVCFDIQADGDVVIAGLPWPSSQPNAGTPAPMRMLTLSKTNPGTTRRIVLQHYSALEATVANRVAIPRETSSLVIANRLETRTFRNMAPTNSGGRYWVLIDGMAGRENYLDNVSGDVNVHDGKEFARSNIAHLLTSVPAGTSKGRQIDAVAGVTVDLTGAEQAENWRRNTIQLIDGAGAGVSGILDVLVNADTTVLLIRSSADVTLRTMSAGGDAGREITIEHDRISGTGTLTVPHNTAGTYNTFYNPNTTTIVLGQTQCLSVRARGGFWRPQASAGQIINSAMANMAGATVKLRAQGAASGPPVDGTGLQLGEIVRFGSFEVLNLAPGVQTITLLATTTMVFVRLSAPGDVIIDQIVHGASPIGVRLTIFRDFLGSAGNVILRDGNATSNSIWTPASVDLVLALTNDATEVVHNGFQWHSHERRLPAMAAGTALGNPIDAAGPATPVPLTGAQQGSMLRRYWYKTHSTPTGSITGYVLTEKEIQIHFNVAVATTVHSFTVSQGKTIEVFLENTSLPVTLPNESVLGTLGLVRTSDALDLTLYGGDGATLTHINNRYRVVGISRNIRPEALAPLAANKAVRYTYHVPYIAGSVGARDVLLTLGETFNQRIVAVSSMLNVAQAASSGQLRSASAGAGAALSNVIATTATATTTDETTRATPNDVTAGTPIYWRLTDGRVAGDLFVDCLRY